MGRFNGSSSSKDRLKWTKELHDLFEKAVHQIGGPDRATPKGILKAMGIPGLTIFHVKSHLQKYRMSVYTKEEDHIRGKSERRSLSEMLPNFSVTAAQLNEALHIQREAQRRLNDQCEVQRSLKMKIEAQTRFFDKIMEEYKNRAPMITKPFKPYSPILSLPSLSEEFESDSEDACTSDIISADEFRAPKRVKFQDNIIPEIHKHSLFSNFPEFQNYGNTLPLDGMNDNGNNLYTDEEIGFPWNIQLPMLRAIYNR